MSSSRRPRLTPRGETYLAARDLAITMARADTPTSRAWLEGFIDGMRMVDAERVRVEVMWRAHPSNHVHELTSGVTFSAIVRNEANTIAISHADAGWPRKDGGEE